MGYAIFQGVFEIGVGGGLYKQKTMEFALNIKNEKNNVPSVTFCIKKARHFASHFYIQKKKDFALRFYI